jgi:hypothetical protein
MKKLKVFIPIILSMIIMLNLTSCFLILNDKKDNGQHRGWYKNQNNPHNPNKVIIIKQGNGNGNGNGHGNGHNNGKH